MKNKKNFFAIAGLAAVMVAGGTFAYFQQELTAENNFATNKFESTLEETFTPDLNWQPGTTTDKTVIVKNTGDYDMIARVSWIETWTRKGANNPFKTVTSQDPSGSVVEKNLSNSMKWVIGGDGHWYYNEVISPNTGKTEAFLESVTLDNDVPMGVYATTYTYFDKDEKQVGTSTTAWTPETMKANGVTKQNITTSLDTNQSGLYYADAEYKLTIIVDTMQATKDAANAEWNTANDTVKTFFATLK